MHKIDATRRITFELFCFQDHKRSVLLIVWNLAVFVSDCTLTAWGFPVESFSYFLSRASLSLINLIVSPICSLYTFLQYWKLSCVLTSLLLVICSLINFMLDKTRDLNCFCRTWYETKRPKWFRKVTMWWDEVGIVQNRKILW